MRRPLLALSALFGIGSLVVGSAVGRGEALALLGFAGLLLLLAPAAARPWATAALGASALALGAASAAVEGLRLEAGGLRQTAAEAEVAGRPVLLSGTVRGDASERGGRLALLLDVDRVGGPDGGAPRTGRARVVVGGASPMPRLLDGERVAAWATLRPARRAEGVRDGVEAFGWCKSARLLERSGPGAGVVRTTAARLREAARSALGRAMPASTERGLVQAMVLGDRSAIDEGTVEAFRASGTYHVLALSGAQVAMLAGLVILGLRRVRAGPWLQAALTGTILGAYALLVGGDVPVVRASLMAGAVLLGRAIEVDTDTCNLLGFAALLLLGHRPSAAADVGFQLSFGATLGILVLAGPLTQGVRRLPLRVDLAIAASLAAQAALAPLLAGWFHRLSPAALVLNIAAVPLSGAVLVAGLGVLLASAVSEGAACLAGDVAWIAAHALRRSGDLGPLGSWLDLRVGAPTAAALALHAAALGLLYRGRRSGGLCLLLALHVALVVGQPSARADGRLHLAVIDVGQGDALLLRSPSGRAVLVDAGGSRDGRFDPGESRVAPLLWGLGVRRLDALVVTHAHPDHVGGAPFLLRAFRVDELWEGLAPAADPAWREVDARLGSFGVKRLGVAAGAARAWDGVGVRVLGPFPPSRPPRRVRNEDSVVLEISLGEVRFLLTGDVSGEAERALTVPRSIVVKVAHHGSRSSSARAFLDAAAPRVALVSAGAHNPFGHPHPEVVERYRAAGALVLRTDRDGTLHVATDGRRVWVRTGAEAHERRIR